MRFDGDPRNQYHIRCIHCGTVEDAPIEMVDTIEQDIREASDYTIIAHRLEFIGVCPACKENENLCPQGEDKGGGRGNG